MPNKKRKTLQYRKAVISDKSQTLYSLLFKALRQLARPHERSEEIGKGDDFFRLINEYNINESMIFGEFVVYEKGASQPILSRDEEVGGTHFQVKFLSMKDVPKEFSGNEADFVNSILYFAVFKNHLILAPSQQVRIDAFEKYLSWLLGVQSGVLAPGVSFSLQMGVHKANLNELESPIVSMEVGGPIRAVETADGVRSLVVSPEGTLSIKNISTFGVGADLLVNFLKSVKAYSPTWESVIQGGDVTARLVITSASRKAETNRGFFTHLQQTCYRNFPPEDVVYRLKDGKEIKGETLLLKKPVSLTVNRDGFISPSELYVEMKN